MKHTIKKEWLGFFVFVLALFLFSYSVSALLIPHRTDYGSTWGSFLQEEEDSLDIVFFGSSIAYCNIIPAVIYEEVGIPTYVMAGPEQTLPMTYYYVKEVFRTQSPKVVAVDITGAFYQEYQDFTKVNIGYMPWSLNRIVATFQTAESEEQLGLLFPLYNYHDRWSDLTLDNLRYTTDIYAGYTLLTRTEVMKELTERAVAFDERVFAQNIQALRDIAAFCHEQGSQVLYFMAPTHHPWERSYRDLLQSEVSEIADADYIDFNDVYDQLEIDETVDFYDVNHFNVYGAVKFSRYLADYLAPYIEESTPVNRELWESRVAAIEEVR